MALRSCKDNLALAPLGRPAADIGFCIEAQGTGMLEVIKEIRMIFQSRVRLQTFLCQLLQEYLLLLTESAGTIGKNLTPDSCIDQLFNVELCSINGAKIRTHRLPLYCQLNFLVRNITAHRGVKLVCFATTARRGASSAIKENHLHTVFG